MSLALSHASIVGDVGVAGTPIPRAAADQETRSTLRLDAATLISDRWQIGTSLPLVRRTRAQAGSEAQAFSIGDISTNIGFEALTDWSYSTWRPKALVFVGVTAPTGRSPQDSALLFQVDSTGRGFWSVQAGALLQKTWVTWDGFLLVEVHQPFARTWASASGDFVLTPQAGISAAFGVGWNRGPFRLGAVVSANYDGPVQTSGAVNGTGAAQWAVPFSLQASYLVADGWTLAALYSEPTIATASNLALARSLGLILQTRWDR